MKGFSLIVLMALIGVMGWRVGNQISSDAVSMAVGVMFGVLAGVPMALMVLASSRRRQGDDEEMYANGRKGGYGGYYPQPPVIVVTGGTAPGPDAGPACAAVRLLHAAGRRSKRVSSRSSANGRSGLTSTRRGA